MIVRIWVDFPGWHNQINGVIQIKDNKEVEPFGPLAACMHSVVGFSHIFTENKRGHIFEFYMGVSLDREQLQEFKTAKTQCVESIVLPGFNFVHLNKYDALKDALDGDFENSRSRSKEANPVFFTIAWNDPGNHIFVDDYPELTNHRGKIIIGDGLRYKLQFVKNEKILYEGDNREVTMINLE